MRLRPAMSASSDQGESGRAGAAGAQQRKRSDDEKPMLQTVAWGANANGQLGVGDTIGRIRPHVVAESMRPANIACGSRFTMILSDKGRVFTHGRGDDGQLGYDTNLQTRPQVVQAFADKTIVDIATRGSHALAVDDEGLVYCWGRDDDGQLGDSGPAPGEDQQKNDGSLQRRTRCEPRIVRTLAESTKIGKVACGRMFSLAVSQDRRSIFSWGCGDDGSLGHGNYVSHETPRRLEGFPLVDQVMDISCGSRHTLCQLSDGALFCWGWGIYGQLGTGDRESRPAPTFVVFPSFDSFGGNRSTARSFDINETRPITFTQGGNRPAAASMASPSDRTPQDSDTPLGSLVRPASSKARTIGTVLSDDRTSSFGDNAGGPGGGGNKSRDGLGSRDVRQNRNTSQAARDAAVAAMSRADELTVTKARADSEPDQAPAFQASGRIPYVAQCVTASSNATCFMSLFAILAVPQKTLSVFEFICYAGIAPTTSNA